MVWQFTNTMEARMNKDRDNRVPTHPNNLMKEGQENITTTNNHNNISREMRRVLKL